MKQTTLSTHTTRIIELLRYIAALQPQESHHDSIPQKDRLLDAGQAARLPGISFPVQHDDAEAWVRVARVQPSSPPSVPEELLMWVVVEDNPVKPPVEPKLRKRIDNPSRPVKAKTTKSKKAEGLKADLEPNSEDEGDLAEQDAGGAYIFLRNNPEIEQAYATWMETWNAWAEKERLVREAAQVYQHLYQLFRDVSAEGPSEVTEVVCGMGHVLWNIRDPESGKVVPYSYPLILQRCEVRLAENEDYALELWPVGQHPTLHLGRLGDGATKEAAEQFWKAKSPGKDDEPFSPFLPQSFSPMVAGLVARLDASGSLQQVGEVLPEPTERLTAYPWFSFFQKKRSHNNLLADLKRLEDAVSNAVALPEILINLVDRDSVHRLPDKLPAFRGVESFTLHQTTDAAQDLYFPLAYNEEQIQVVQRLEVSAGVVVQGPPGTGKSHTIANIVSHYLANGQRVLVTSHSAAALAAVREKIPDSIRDLSVALLTSETESLADFEKSVREIADRLATFNRNVSQRVIDDLMHAVNGLYKQLETLDLQIVEHMGVHHTTHVLKGETVTLMDLARFYAQHPAAPSWMGRVPDAAPNPQGSEQGYIFPSVPEQIDEKLIQSIRQARLDAGAMFPALFEPISDPSTWPQDKEVRSAISAQQRLNKLQKQLNDGLNKAKSSPLDDTAVWALTGDVDTLTEAIAELQRSQAQAEALEGLVRRPARADEAILGDESTGAQAPADFCRNIISLRNQLRNELGVFQIPAEAVRHDEFRQAVERGAATGAPVGGFFQRMTANKSVKGWIDEVKVDGQRPTTPETWKRVEEHLRLLKRAEEIPSSWGLYANAFGWTWDSPHEGVENNKSLVVSSSNSQDLFKHIDHIAKTAEFQITRSEWRKKIAPAIENALAKIFVDPIAHEVSAPVKSKWTRSTSEQAPSIHLRAKPGRSEEQHEPLRITSPWAQWDQKTEMEREAALNVAERSLNLWQSIDEEQRYLTMFKDNIQQLLTKSKVHAVLPDLPPLPIPPKTRQTVAAPVTTFMDKVRQFLEVDMWAAKETDFGRRSSSRSIDSDPGDTRVSQWRSLLISAERMYGVISLAAKPAEHALHVLAQAGFGDWVHALIKNPLDNLPNPKRVAAALPDDPLLPENWKDLVQQAQIQAFLSTLNEQQTLMAYFNTRRTVVQSLSTHLSELAAEKSWAKLALGVTPQQRQALGAYLSAVRAVGSGTGKRSARHQQDARFAMAEAFSAVPCWIMPTAKVSEVMPSELELFDLVIVDEASQSDLAALPALIRGKKILIVGDDKQVSPSNFVQEDLILQQRRTLLANQPFAPLMAPDRSIYDLFSGVLPNSSIMLREHFRCVAPIISWSNKNYYHNKMVPLRIPSGAERLDPPLIDVFVEDGKMEDDVNEAEATVIAREIQQIVADPQMAHKSIGVVTLPSKDAQSNKIRDAIDQAISQAAYINHKILVGPPARFQGSERDIMFVAMTWDGNSGGASDRPEFHQRFNVAMSRARDRMILVRSIPDAALRSGTLLSKVVHHFHDEHSAQNRSGLEYCKSDLERDIFQALNDQGYYVQAHIGPKHAQIDLVVEDKWGRRLAIECDGDIPANRLMGGAWHESWQSAVTNQRILERAGWTFLRVTAAAWYLEPQQTLHKILTRLEELGVTPYQESEQRDVLLVERKTVRAVVEPEPIVEPVKISRFARTVRLDAASG